MVVHWYQGLMALVLPSLKSDLNLTAVQVGTITTAQMGVNGVITLPSGYLADSYRKRRGLILGAAIVALGSAYFLMGNAHSHGWVLVAAGLVGLGSALWHPGATGALSLQFPDRRGFALAMHGVGASIGDGLSPVTVGAIIVAVSWRPALQYHLIPALVLAVILWKSLAGRYEAQGSKPPFRSYLGDIRSMLADRQVLALLGSGTLNAMATLSIVTFLPIYIQETLGYSSFTLGVYLSLLYVMGMISQPVMGLMSDRIGRKAVLVPSFIAMGFLYVAMVFAHGGIQLGVTIGALGLFFYAILSVLHSAVLDVAPEGVQSSTFGILALLRQPFSLSSPILAGYLVTEFGITITFWYAAIAMFLAAAVLLPIRFKRASVPSVEHLS
ncbi:MAG: MFS transporter [Dehalococcoidia bacterium]